MAVPARSFSSVLSRDIVTPVTIILFGVSTVTGIMLLVHWQGALVKPSHEWLSVVFSAIAVWHLVRNWRPFLGYLRRRVAVVALAVSLVLSVVFTGMTGTTAPVSPGAVFHALAEASLADVAPAFGLELDQARATLRAAGVDATGDDTLATIGARAGLGGPGVMTLLARSPDRTRP
ncbi:DUF4405 domain-containing protein [Roseospira marina]|uniref:DUF4405 domain-containing protein n=1 Tax=Roseospira marina TaxID=140057 RepID=A0A5M6ICT9_9PROT|nr:DUF4405 domain-containing protein [Roseospira marina]KAA5606090.1 DUF4405 domain-containing protein [Roseospira marina]MBB4313044.1 hypothetical protein [Roseospira marina]MBB5086215.1 hypothetical protein [Roseospira marina]